MSRGRIILAIVIAALAGVWAGWSANTFLAIDGCLDRGGAWEEHGSYCYGVPSAAERDRWFAGGHDEGTEPYFPQLISDSADKELVLLSGTLVLEGRCLLVRPANVLVVWPAASRLERDNGRYVVVHPPSGARVAVGDPIRLDGATKSRAIFGPGTIRQPLPRDCPQEVWLGHGMQPG